ncbi:MAG: homocitrate synthase [Gammaproteobacteria bacterium]|nr:homocitrate synthase [Gammaproteobacteria bacterium]|tara:strand:+ start:343 stop:1401 length:1059 start_codon:yes stop_codon:yes gene_type:complete
MNTRQVVVIPGDDAAPEAMAPVVSLIGSLVPEIDWQYPLVGEAAIEATGHALPDDTKTLIDSSETTLFGSTSGKSGAALFYLRWGKQTYANVRPTRWFPGYKSSLADPEGVDFIIVRENLEDLYLGIEGDVPELAELGLKSRTSRRPLAEFDGRYALKVITDEGSRRVITKAFELARTRRGKLTATSKYNMLSYTDGLFRDVAIDVARDFPDVEFEMFIVDDFANRLCKRPQDFDVVVMPNLYGDILSDAAAGLVGGLGMAASGCYGDDYAYFESAHGTAPDIAGQHVINPTATLLSACMMLDYMGMNEVSTRIHGAIAEVYAEGRVLTPDQGGNASTTDLCDAILARCQTR